MKLTDFQIVLLVLFVAALFGAGIWMGISFGAALGDILSARPLPMSP